MTKRALSITLSSSGLGISNATAGGLQSSSSTDEGHGLSILGDVADLALGILEGDVDDVVVAERPRLHFPILLTESFLELLAAGVTFNARVFSPKTATSPLDLLRRRLAEGDEPAFS